MKLLCLIFAALLLTAVVIDASPTQINIGGGGAQGGGHGGGHGGPNWNPDGWQRAFSRARVIAPESVSDSRFVDRRLLVKVVPRTMQETDDNDVAEWREGLAGIKKDLRRTVVGTPLPANRFDKSAGV